jgi:hypothetical protein
MPTISAFRSKAMRLDKRQYRALVSALSSIDLDDDEIAGKDRTLVTTISSLIEVFRSNASITERTFNRIVALAREQENRLTYA